ncbi:hypothetical protein T06_12231 [Trichinella sp. T6]|nr:hypothetical protein T06_1452 [Trichinella sp. T6]KRX70902.1 hypothetical protein T06_12231 [Trichinella sp. T6]
MENISIQFDIRDLPEVPNEFKLRHFGIIPMNVVTRGKNDNGRTKAIVHDSWTGNRRRSCLATHSSTPQMSSNSS